MQTGTKPLLRRTPITAWLGSALLALTTIGCSDHPKPAPLDGATNEPGSDASADAEHPMPSDAAADSAPPDSAAAAPDAATPDAAAPDAAPDAARPPDDSGPSMMADATPQNDGSMMMEDDSGGPLTGSQPDSGTPSGTFALRVVTLGLEAPWEIIWGPDNQLWITERVGKRVIRVDPTTGSKAVTLTVPDAYQSTGQDGVLGMALNPRLGQVSSCNCVYLAYTYDADPGTDVDRRAKIVRYSYDALSQTLVAPMTLIDGLSASSDHNAGRLVYGPDDRLYYTIGDQGKNQFDNKCFVNRAQALPTQAAVNDQDWSTYEGKVLRLELDGSIPADNPTLAGVRSHIYSYGHRNPQGIAFGPDGKLYSDEQGPKTDDEINWIQPGKNYGWPQIAGYQDNKAYSYGNWSASDPEPCTNLAFSDYGWPQTVPTQRETEWTSLDFVPPLMTFYTVDTGFNFMDPACAGNEFICWPTIAPSSLETYVAGNDGLSWGTSLLLTSLKEGSVFRVQLSADGQTTVGAATALFKTTNRYRDLAIAPDKRTFYVITDSDGMTSVPTSGSTQALEHRGAILEFSYVP